MTTDQNRLPSHVQAERAIEHARFLALAPQLSPLDGTGAEVHLHYHQAPAPVPQLDARPQDEAGWLLLNRMVPYLVLAGMLILIITGCAVVLVWAMGMLVALIHSLFALVIAGIGVIGALALLAGVLRPLFTGPSIIVNGNRNRVGQTRK